MSTNVQASVGPAGAEAPSEPLDGAPPVELDRGLREPRSLVDHLVLSTPLSTLVYWLGVGLVALSVFVPRLLPCVDYPQHLGLADIARRLGDPAAPEHATHYINYFTYNGLFHLLVSRLARLMPIELAGKLVVSISLGLLGGSTLALFRVLRRPPAYAALFTPLLFSFALGWGFVNYALGTAIAVTALVFVAKSLVRPTPGTLAGTAVFALLCAMTHVLAMLALCLLAATLAPEVAVRAVRRGGSMLRLGARAVFRMATALAPILVGAAWCIQVYRIQYKWDPVMYKDATLEGTSPPMWQKLAYFGSWSTGLHSDLTDQVLVCATIAFAFAAWGVAIYTLVRRRQAAEVVSATSTPSVGGGLGAPVFLPFAAMLATYLVTPMVFIGTHLIFPRLAQLVVLAGLLSLPVFSPRMRAASFRLALTIGALAGLNLFGHMLIFARECDDAARVLDDLPKGRAAAAVIYGADTFAFRNGSLIHWAAYYGAFHNGDWAYSFARYLSVPVRFKPGMGPWWPKKGWEFAPADYNVRCKYARHFDLLLAKAPHDVSTEPEVRRILFGAEARTPKLLSHHGEYWAFDTQGVPEDGTF